MTRNILADYCRAGFALVSWNPKTGKGPTWPGWNLRKSAVTDPETAAELDGNIGLCHAWSGTCCIDLDDLAQATEWLLQRGVQIDEYLNAPDAVLVSSGRENRAKLLYRTPRAYPSFRLPGFELRCGTKTGTTVQDVLPPSVHPDTGHPYTWAGGGDWRSLPELPEAFRLIWAGLITPEAKISQRKPRDYGNADMEALRKLVALHSPDGGCRAGCALSDSGYDHWLQVGMAIHYRTDGSEDGYDLFDDWSAKGAKYEGREDTRAKWRSFDAQSARPVTDASLRIEEAASADEFEVCEPAEIARASQTAATLSEEGQRALRTLTKDGGKFDATISNVVTMLSVAETYGHILARDTFKDLLVIAPAGSQAWRAVTDTDYTRIREWAETAGNFWPLSKEMVRDALYLVAEQNSVDTAQKWLAGLQWDGVPRVESFCCTYWGTVNAEYERAVSRYLWTALAGRVMEPGCQVDMVPILVGGQGLGKSTGVRALVPDEQFFVELRFDDSDDSLARKMRGVLVGELAELQGLRTSDIERIKAFITRTHEKWIPKYMEFATEFPRRLVMVGTTNEDEFLNDQENRRWLPLRTAGVDVPAIRRDRDQLWAEGLARWTQHGVEWQDAERLGRLNTEQYTLQDTWQQIIEQWLADSGNPRRVRTADLITAAVGIDPRHMTRVHELRVSRIMRSLGWDKRVVRIGGKNTRCWELEPARSACKEITPEDLI